MVDMRSHFDDKFKGNVSVELVFWDLSEGALIDLKVAVVVTVEDSDSTVFAGELMPGDLEVVNLLLARD